MSRTGARGRPWTWAAWGGLAVCLAGPAAWAQTPMTISPLPPTPSEGGPPEPSASAPVARSYVGRISVVIQTDPLQQMIADFELEGDASKGELRLFGPFGGAIATLQWEPGQAVLIEGERRRVVRSIDWLIERVTGAALPVALIFDWLAGRPVRTDDWAVAPRSKPSDPLRATRLQPLPRIELTLAIKASSP